MVEPAVVNSSPLILLAKADRLDLLRLAGSPILVPADVGREVRAHAEADAAVLALDRPGLLEIVEVERIPDLILAWDLGVGESSVLAWASAHPGTTAVLDDLAARRCARALGIPLRGTMGLVLVARLRGLIPAARPVLKALREAGLYLSDEILHEALRNIGE